MTSHVSLTCFSRDAGDIQPNEASKPRDRWRIAQCTFLTNQTIIVLLDFSNLSLSVSSNKTHTKSNIIDFSRVNKTQADIFDSGDV